MVEEKIGQIVEDFREDNTQNGLRVFVAGGSRPGCQKVFTEEAYNLGKQIAQMGFKLDFGLSNSGIMGAVAKGVLDGWNSIKYGTKSPIKGVTTKEYFELYKKDQLLSQIEDVIMAKTLEERKQKLLDADFIVFAPGGVGTLMNWLITASRSKTAFCRLNPLSCIMLKDFFIICWNI